MSLSTFLDQQMEKHGYTIPDLVSHVNNKNKELLISQNGNGEPKQYHYSQIKRLFIEHQRKNWRPTNELITLLSAVFEISKEEFILRCSDEPHSLQQKEYDIITDSDFINKTYNTLFKKYKINSENGKDYISKQSQDREQVILETIKSLVAIDNELNMPSAEKGEIDQWINLLQYRPDTMHVFTNENGKIIGDCTLVMHEDPQAIKSDSEFTKDNIVPANLSGEFHAHLLTLQLENQFSNSDFLVIHFLLRLLELATQRRVFVKDVFVRAYGDQKAFFSFLGFEYAQEQSTDENSAQLMVLNSFDKIKYNCQKFKLDPLISSCLQQLEKFYPNKKEIQ